MTKMLIALFMMFLSSTVSAANLCPADQILARESVGSGSFGLTGGAEAIGELKNRYEIRARNERPQVTQDNQDFVIFESPVFLLEIKPKVFKSSNTCVAYAKTHVFNKVFEESANINDEASCKEHVEKTVSDWVQGTLVGSASRWVGGDTSEGDYLFNACPDPCSYSSAQENIYSYDGKVCQIRVQLSVTCGAPKAKNEFLAQGSYLKKSVCLQKRPVQAPKIR